MNAPENINIINAAHGVLQRAKDALSVAEVALAIGASKPVASKQLKELYRQGLIESEPRAGGTSFYRLIADPKAIATDVAAEMAEPLDFATSPEVQYLAPEDYEMPPADPALLAMANRTLSEQLDEYRGQLAHIATTAADYLPDPSDITTARAVEIMDMLIEAQAETIQAFDVERTRLKAENLALKTLNEAMPGFGAEHQEQRIDSLTKDVINTRTALTNALNEANRLRAELATERQAREALQEQDGVDVKDAAVGYLIRVTKRKPRYVTQPERARDAALAAVRAGAGRAEVLAVVPVGVARRGAEWQASEIGG